ncbi:4Fe-4S binding protein [Collinsella sp. An2]|uniref:4Fe-4S binding protein n=1 Tax=Collinsella sp. An2 TaxID=1965585 RepID=UPI00117F985B|nr:4Fe-4S binding protein [Collinsella sp. An2]
MHKAQQGICCPGCPHRAAYVTVKDAVGRGRGKVFCGDAGCPAVGEVHPAATTCPGGMARLLPRYAQAIPGKDEARPKVCVHFIRDEQLVAACGDDGISAPLDHLASEGEIVLPCILASSKGYLDNEGIKRLAELAEQAGAADVTVMDPFDTRGCQDIIRDMAEVPGVHAIIFASPCALLQTAHPAEPAEVDHYSCVGCQRCVQITGCPALSFQPPSAVIDADACSGCDLCADYCRTHVILSPCARMTPEERRAARYAAVRG